jgi:hypothetical protein
MTGSRVPGGSRLDLRQPLTFSFDCIDYPGYVGDSLASAL